MALPPSILRRVKSRASTDLPLVSVLVLSYARLDLLRETTRALRRLDYPALEFVLADDGSPPTVQRHMRQLPYDRFVFHRRNRGLGANSNSGLRACSGNLILQVQDDWAFDGPDDLIFWALEAFKARPDLGLLRLACLPNGLQSTSEALPTGCVLHVMQHPSASSHDDQRWLYSDTPHMKTKRMVQNLGPYLEGVPMQWSEVEMRERFLTSRRFEVGYLGLGSVFQHIGPHRSHRVTSLLQKIGQKLIAGPITGGPVRSALRLYSRVTSVVAHVADTKHRLVVESRAAGSSCVGE